MSYTDAINSPEDAYAILPIFLATVLIHFMTKLLRKVGVVTNKNFESYAKISAVIIGGFYAYSLYPLPHGFGGLIDIIILAAGGSIVGFIVYGLFLFGGSFSGLDNK